MSEKLLYKIEIDSTQKNDQKVSLYKGNDLIDELAGDIDLVSSIKKIVEKNKISINDIVEFDAKSGSGSFTGIKKGVTVANVLNWAMGIQKKVQAFYGAEPKVN